MKPEERIVALEEALREMLCQFWDNGAYSEDDEVVLLKARDVLKGDQNETV